MGRAHYARKAWPPLWDPAWKGVHPLLLTRPHRLPLGCKTSNRGTGYPGNCPAEPENSQTTASQHLAAQGSGQNSTRSRDPGRAADGGLRQHPRGQLAPRLGSSTGITFSCVCKPPAGPAPRRTGRKCQTLWRPSPSRQPGTILCFRFQSRTPQCPLPPQLRPPAPCRERGSEKTHRCPHLVGDSTITLHTLEWTELAEGVVCVPVWLWHVLGCSLTWVQPGD